MVQHYWSLYRCAMFIDNKLGGFSPLCFPFKFDSTHHSSFAPKTILFLDLGYMQGFLYTAEFTLVTGDAAAAYAAFLCCLQ